MSSTKRTDPLVPVRKDSKEAKIEVAIEVEVKETAVFAKITRQQITEYLERKEGWEMVNDIGGKCIWLNREFVVDGECARFDVPNTEVADWGWICKTYMKWIAHVEGVGVLDILMRFGALNVQDLFHDNLIGHAGELPSGISCEVLERTPLMHWVVPESFPTNSIDDMPQEYCVTTSPLAAQGIVLWGKYGEEWIPNPNPRPILFHLLNLLGIEVEVETDEN